MAIKAAPIPTTKDARKEAKAARIAARQKLVEEEERSIQALADEKAAIEKLNNLKPSDITFEQIIDAYKIKIKRLYIRHLQKLPNKYEMELMVAYITAVNQLGEMK